MIREGHPSTRRGRITRGVVMIGIYIWQGLHRCRVQFSESSSLPFFSHGSEILGPVVGGDAIHVWEKATVPNLVHDVRLVQRVG